MAKVNRAVLSTRKSKRKSTCGTFWSPDVPCYDTLMFDHQTKPEQPIIKVGLVDRFLDWLRGCDHKEFLDELTNIAIGLENLANKK